MPGDRLPDGPDVIMQSDSRGHPNYYLDTDDIDASTAKATRTTGRSLGAVADDGRLRDRCRRYGCDHVAALPRVKAGAERPSVVADATA